MNGTIKIFQSYLIFAISICYNSPVTIRETGNVDYWSQQLFTGRKWLVMQIDNIKRSLII